MSYTSYNFLQVILWSPNMLSNWPLVLNICLAIVLTDIHYSPKLITCNFCLNVNLFLCLGFPKPADFQLTEGLMQS